MSRNLSKFLQHGASASAGALASIGFLTSIWSFYMLASGANHEDWQNSFNTVAPWLLAFGTVSGAIAGGAISYHRNRPDRDEEQQPLLSPSV